MIQEQFLAALQKARVQVAVYLVSGVRLQGTVESSDQYGVMLGGSSQQFIFKRAISTIVPSREVSARTPSAAAAAPPEPPPMETRPAENEPVSREAVAEKKETAVTPVVRVKRTVGSKIKLAKGE